MGEFNSDELDAPSWLNEEFFKEVLRKDANDDSISITDLKITPGSGKGDHYASIMFRATLVYDGSNSKGNAKSYIIKTMPEFEGHKKDLLGESFIFETEIAMYSDTIPKFEAELRKAGDQTVLGAKCIYHSLTPRKCIIFEDIVPKGYTTIQDRLANLEEAKAALLKLAKWHAVSYKLAAEGDKSVTSYKEGFLNFKDVETMPFISTGITNFIEVVEQDDELKKFAPKLRTIQNDIIKRCIASAKSYQPDAPEGIFVLCHGDFHVKNLMCKRNDKGELEDVMLLDFQICNFAPAVFDLAYAVYMLFSDELRRNHQDELIYYYCTIFGETLEKLKFEGKHPKVADFYIDFLRHKHWELFLISTFLPMSYAMTRGNMDPNEMMSSDEARRKNFDYPVYINEIKQLLPRLANRGYLD